MRGPNADFLLRYASSFFITVAASQSSWGKAYKYWPLKIVFLTAIGIFELGSLICGVSPNSVALIVGHPETLYNLDIDEFVGQQGHYWLGRRWSSWWLLYNVSINGQLWR